MRCFALLCAAGPLHATTYTFDRAVGAANVSGFLETDGTIGVLGSSNFTDWSVTITGPNYANTLPTLTLLNSNLHTSGSNLTATATGITFNFGSNYSFFFVQGSYNPQGLWCFITSGGCAGNDANAESAWDQAASILELTPSSGPVLVASVAAVPLAASLPLLASGFGFLGLMGARSRRKAKSKA